MPTITVQVGSYNLSDANGILVTDIASESHSTPLSLDIFTQNRRDGGKLVSAYFKPKLFSVQGILKAATYEALTQLIDTFKQNVVGTNLKLYISDGTNNRMYVVNTSDNVDIPRQRQHLTFVPFKIDFIAADPPFGYEATVGADKTATTAVSQSAISVDVYTASFTASGTAKPESKIKITVDTVGDLTGLDIVDLTNSRTMNITRTFAAGDVIVVDTASQTVKVNAEDVAFTGQFPDFQVGSNQIGINGYTSTGLIIDQQQALSNSQVILYGANTRFCQSFIPSSTSPLSRIAFVANKVGSPGVGLLAEVYADSGDAPTGAALASVAITPATITSIFQWINVNFPTNPNLTSGTKYWFVVRMNAGAGDVDNYYQIRTYTPDNYSSGSLKKTTNGGGSYSAVTGYDMAFKEYRAVAGQKNEPVEYDTFGPETFATNTNKDAANTTADWNNGIPALSMIGVAASQNDAVAATGSDALMTGASFLWGKATPWSPTKSGTLTQVRLYLKRGSSTEAQPIYVELRNRNNGSTLGSLVATSSTTVNQSSLTTSYAQYTFNFNVSVNAGGLYDIYVYYAGTTLCEAYVRAGTVSGQTVWDIRDTGAVVGTSSNTSLDYYTNVNYTSLATAEQGQTITLDSTDCDILSVSQYTQTILTGGSTYQGRVSADNGTTWLDVPRDNSPFQTETIPTVNGSALKWRWVLQNLTGSNKPYVTSTAVYYRKGIALDATTDWGAQSFVPTTTGNIQRLDLYLAKVGTPGNITVEIQTDSGGNPSGTLVNANATKTLTAADLATGGVFQWLTFSFPAAFSLTSGTTYWIVVKAAATVDNSNKWLVCANTGEYTTGAMKRSANSGGAWTAVASGEDLMFRTYGAAGANFSLTLLLQLFKRFL